MMEKSKLELYWSEIPAEKESAVSYADLCRMWNCNERVARSILHELSVYDDGSDYVLIRSGRGKGFFKTDDENVIREYRKECLNKGKSIFAPLKKIDRVLKSNDCGQFQIINNLRLVREVNGLSQTEVVSRMKEFDIAFDKPMLSKMENNVVWPTKFQLEKLAEIYGVSANELLNEQFIV